MGKLSNKVAVVTGGTSGIGLATAKRFVDEGAYVFINGRRQAELDKAKAQIGKNISVLQGDVANLDDLDRLYKVVKSEKGGIDIAIANAGFVETQTLATSTPEHFDRSFNTNARNLLYRAKGAAVNSKWWLDRSRRIVCHSYGNSFLHHVLGDQGRLALIFEDVGRGPKRPRHSGKHLESGRHRHCAGKDDPYRRR
jgi:NAD(P)-dependent dehydrogenase (short-subunit alcohol dehydrogenase family)